MKNFEAFLGNAISNSDLASLRIHGGCDNPPCGDNGGGKDVDPGSGENFLPPQTVRRNDTKNPNG